MRTRRKSLIALVMFLVSVGATMTTMATSLTASNGAQSPPPRYLPGNSLGLIASGLEQGEIRQSAVAFTQSLGDKERKKGVTIDATKNAVKYGALVVKQNPTKRKIHGQKAALVKNAFSLQVAWVEKDIYMTVESRGVSEADTFAIADAVKFSGKPDPLFELSKFPAGLQSVYAGPKNGLIKSFYRVSFGATAEPKDQDYFLTVEVVDPRYLAVTLTEFTGSSELTVRGKKAYQSEGGNALSWLEKPNLMMVAVSNKPDLKAFAESLASVDDSAWTNAMKTVKPLP
jgi:hypothetical protein